MYCPARVNDVLDEQDMAPGQGALDHVGDLHPAGGPCPRAVACGAHELQLGGNREAAQQVGRENRGPFEDRDDDQWRLDVGVNL